MATLILTGLGSFIGGPAGGAIGSLIGSQIDSGILGTGKQTGPRLKDLSVTTSSYGQAIPRHFGTMRVAGSIIWSSELAEASETSGGGKGKPKTKTYSYSSSFAVALSSRPIRSLGRIWADGKLLRGAAGDLKTGGNLRIYYGNGDEQIDPLIAGAEGSCPAFRGLAYVVFEDLQLEDFGNRTPALTFEVRADPLDQVGLDKIAPGISTQTDDAILPEMLGFSDEGSSLGSTLDLLSLAYPFTCATSTDALVVSQVGGAGSSPPTLPEHLYNFEANDTDEADYGSALHRAPHNRPAPRSLRYYDKARDFQPGVQRSVGRATNGREEMIEIPACFDASGARIVSNRVTERSRWSGERLRWLVAELDEAIQPGNTVKVPGHSGSWLVHEWEWHDRGVTLDLERIAPYQTVTIAADAGQLLSPPDLLEPPTQLWAFELPWDGTGSPNSSALFAAASAENAAWRGANLYSEQANTLVSLGLTISRRAVVGTLTNPLVASNALYFEKAQTLEVELVGDELDFQCSTIEGLSAGANRLLVGDEIIQFLDAEQLSARAWKLTGLLRGRGGTEHMAAAGHAAGALLILLDQSLVALDPANVPSVVNARIAAIGRGDDDAVIASISGLGTSRRPLSPVHTSRKVDEAGSWVLSWTRRARGQWRWLDGVDAALVEERELFEVGVGSEDAPVFSRAASANSLVISAAEITSLTAEHPGFPVWVRQIGTYGRSPPTLIAVID